MVTTRGPHPQMSALIDRSAGRVSYITADILGPRGQALGLSLLAGSHAIWDASLWRWVRLGTT